MQVKNFLLISPSITDHCLPRRSLYQRLQEFLLSTDNLANNLTRG